MPNWCFNTLIVLGDAEDVEDFGRRMQSPESPLDLSKLSPVAGTEGNSVEENEGPEGDGGQIASEGQNCESDCESEDAIKFHFTGRKGFGPFLMYKFVTRWSPPIDWLEDAASIFPDLQFELSYCVPEANKSGCIARSMERGLGYGWN